VFKSICGVLWIGLSDKWGQGQRGFFFALEIIEKKRVVGVKLKVLLKA